MILTHMIDIKNGNIWTIYINHTTIFQLLHNVTKSHMGKRSTQSGRQIDFTVTSVQKVWPDFRLQLTFDFWHSIKEYPQPSKKRLTFYFFQLHYLRLDYLHILQSKQSITTDSMQMQISVQLSSIMPDRRDL